MNFADKQHDISNGTCAIHTKAPPFTRSAKKAYPMHVTCTFDFDSTAFDGRSTKVIKVTVM